MKTVVLSALAISIAVSLVACGGGGPGATPKETFEAVKKLAEKKDFAGFWNMLSPASQKDVGEKFEEMKKGWAQMPDEMKEAMKQQLGDPTTFSSARDFFISMAEKNPDESTAISKGTFVEAKEEGNKAKVTFKVDGKDDDMDLEKVDGKWYVAID